MTRHDNSVGGAYHNDNSILRYVIYLSLRGFILCTPLILTSDDLETPSVSIKAKKRTSAHPLCKKAHYYSVFLYPITKAKKGGRIIYMMPIDPFCGSGTVVIEGAMMAKNIAPGISRSFAAQNWDFIPECVWKDEFDRAKGLETRNVPFTAYASDIDKNAVELTEHNAVLAGVGDSIKTKVCDIRDFTFDSDTATVITNPPYGERLLDFSAVHEIYEAMGKIFTPQKGKSYGIISPDEEFEKYFSHKANKRRKLYNGMIKCQFYMYYNYSKYKH